jgi:magnesium transporter
MPPLEGIDRPVWSAPRKVGILTLRGYLVLAMILVLAKVAQVALAGTGHAQDRTPGLRARAGPRSSAPVCACADGIALPSQFIGWAYSICLPMTRKLITTQGACTQPSAADLEAHLKQGDQAGFWLDIESPSEEDYELLRQTFGFHPLTIEDLRSQNQRPKLEEYRGYSFAVVFASELRPEGLRLLEHHLYLGYHYLITVHHEPAPGLAELRSRIEASPELTKGEIGFLTYLVIDQLVDSNFPTLEALDETVDRLLEQIVERAEPPVLSLIYRMKHDVADLRRVLSAQRDLFQRIITHSLDTGEHELAVYWRDVYDHIVRQSETVDSLRDLLTGAMDVYLSTVSNRLGTTMKTLTIVASLFLPLTWLTGFYGMNFAYLTGTLEPARWAFWVGVATMIGSLGVQVYMFRRRGWL